jgi:GTPase SAR1 family protein
VSERPVEAFVERVATALRNNGEPERAQALTTELRSPHRERPALFVVGEDKRGKSCLVNALLGRPDLSPVGVEVVTGAPITFFAASPPTAMVFRYGEPKPKTVELDEARSLATVAGNPGNRENIRAVAIGLDIPLLAGLNLIDTPGVGGLDSGHGALTLQSLGSADALLFAIEAGAQFRSAELSFLRRAASRVDTVILVLTKVDLYRGWRTILEDNRHILESEAPRFADCPVVAVSSMLALRGLESQNPDESLELRRESGIDLLERTIDEHVVSRSQLLHVRNVVRAATAEVAGLERLLQDRLASMDGAGGSREALEAEQQRLEELRQSKADWPQRLDLEVRKLSLERSEAATRGTLEIKRRYDERLRHVGKQDIETLPGELIADLTALAGSLNEAAVDRLFSVVQDVLTDIDSAGEVRESLGSLTTTSLRSDLESFAMGPHELAVSDKLSVLSSFASGRSLGALGGATVAAILAPPVGMAVGFGIGGLFAFQAFHSRTQHAFAAAFQPWMAAQISQTQTAINTTFARRMLDLQGDLRTAIIGAIAQRETQIAETLESGKQLLQAEEGKRVAAEQALNQRAEIMKALQKRGAELLARPQPSDAPDGTTQAHPHDSGSLG